MISPEDILAGKKVQKIENLEVLFMTMQSVIKMIDEEIQKSLANEQLINNQALTKCANGVKWILSLGSDEYKVMGIKDLISVNKKVMVAILLNRAFLSMCPELMNFANENAVVFKSF